MVGCLSLCAVCCYVLSNVVRGCSVFAIGCCLTLSVVCLLLCGGVLACWLLLFVVRCLSLFGGCGRMCALFKCGGLLSGVCCLLCCMCRVLSFGQCSVLVGVCCCLLLCAVGVRCCLLLLWFVVDCGSLSLVSSLLSMY